MTGTRDATLIGAALERDEAEVEAPESPAAAIEPEWQLHVYGRRGEFCKEAPSAAAAEALARKLGEVRWRVEWRPGIPWRSVTEPPTEPVAAPDPTPEMSIEWRLKVFGAAGEFVLDLPSRGAAEAFGTQLRSTPWRVEFRAVPPWAPYGPRMRARLVVELDTED